MTWTLSNGEELHAENPRSFFIPPREARESLEPGALVKLVFLDAAGDGERMWVEVESRTADGFTGTLDNDPVVVTTLSAGDPVAFRAEHVVSIYSDEPDPFAALWATASERLFRDDDPEVGHVRYEPEAEQTTDDGRRLSGWMVLVGDEPEGSLAEPGALRRPNLGWLIERHPELADLVTGHDGTQAVYIRTDDGFAREG